MTGSLEDPLAELMETVAVHITWLRRPGTPPLQSRADNLQSADYLERLSEVVRAASVVPAEPATHDGPWPKFCPICLAEFHADGTVTPAVAAVDGEVPAT